MHYKFLSALGEHYDAEEGTEGVRRNAFAAIEGSLNAAIMALNALVDANTPKTNVGASVREKAQFFKDAASFSGKSKAQIDTPAIMLARAKVERYKRLLMLQGATFSPNGSIDWGLSKRVVVYDRDLAAQGLTKLRYSGGKLYFDDAFQKPVDTTNMVTHFSGPGFAIYVMSESGAIHVSSHSVGFRHHSSLLAGANVAGAGEMKVLKGKLTWISNKSGHYAPSGPHFLQVLHQLQKEHVDLSAVKVKYLTASTTDIYNSVGDFLAAMQSKGVESYDIAKLLKYAVLIPFAEFCVLAAAQGWRWRTPAEANSGLPNGVYTIAGGANVAPKLVRQWLKGLGRTASVDVQSGAGR